MQHQNQAKELHEDLVRGKEVAGSLPFKNQVAQQQHQQQPKVKLRKPKRKVEELTSTVPDNVEKLPCRSRQRGPRVRHLETKNRKLDGDLTSLTAMPTRMPSPRKLPL